MRLEEHRTVAGSPDAVLAFVADFANLSIWDWSAGRVDRLAGSGLAVGNRYRVHLGLGPLTTPLDYTVTQYHPGHSATLLSESGAVRSEDTILVEAAGDQTALTYIAELGTGRLGAVVELAIRPLFALHARVVMARLQAVLAERALVEATTPSDTVGSDRLAHKAAH
jgi:Polyketide cyclase / dehydrase and lipid transport